MKAEFDKNAILPELPGILLLSHGPLAISLLRSAELILDKLDNCAAFALEESDDVDAFGNIVKEAIEIYPKGTIVMVDLFGGSPCNQVIKMMLKRELELHVITGMNLPMLIEAECIRESLKGEELIEALRRAAVEGILNVADKLEG